MTTTTKPTGAAAMMLRGKANRSKDIGDLTRAADPNAPKPIDPAAVTGTDEERLAVFEAAIEEAKGTADATLKAARARFAIEAGTALRAIQDQHLYLLSHETFEQYIGKRWDMDRTRAYQLIEAAPVMLAMSKIFHTPPVESQARALVPAFRKDGEQGIREVHAIAQQQGVKVTAAVIKNAARSLGYVPEPAAAPDDVQVDVELLDSPEQAAKLVRAEQAVAALRSAQRQIRGTVLADAVAADPVRGGELAVEAEKLADEIGRLAVKAKVASRA